MARRRRARAVTPTTKVQAPQAPAVIAPLSEIGVTGLHQFDGWVYERPLPDLSPHEWRRELHHMTRTDAVVGAVTTAITLLIRQSRWQMRPASQKRRDVAAADFVWSCLNDMSSPWSMTLSEIMSMLDYGWSYFETVYKLRQGRHPRGARPPTASNDPFATNAASGPAPSRRAGTPQSAYNDGKIGWRKWAIRAQDTLVHWEFDDSGGVQAMVQRAAPTFDQRTIPIERALLFRPATAKNNPEGASIYRNAWRSWRIKSGIEQIEAIGIERDLAGYPVMYVPLQMMQTTASEAEKEVLAQLIAIVKGVRRDENEGLVLPQSYDAHGNPLFKFELMSAGGQRQFNVEEVITRYDTRIAQVALADFILMGHTRGGSYGMTATKSELFTAAINTWIGAVADVINQHAIPRLLDLNGYELDAYPELAHSQIKEVDLNALGTFILRLAQSGAKLFPSKEMTDYLITLGGMPVPDDDDRPSQDPQQAAPVQAPLHGPAPDGTPQDVPQPAPRIAPGVKGDGQDGGDGGGGGEQEPAPAQGGRLVWNGV